MDPSGGPPPLSSPLRQLSSEQMNQPRIPQSPSMPTFQNENERPHHHRSRESVSSDVRGKVDFLNSLSNPSSPTKANRPFIIPQAPTNGALQRAMLGFEESQASLATANAEIEKLREQLKSGKHREKLVSERIESLIDQLSTERESRNNDKKYYVIEVKKCRKQAYQAELNQLETQESLKEAKQELRRAQSELAAERTKKEEARQEAFERAYAVSGLSEEAETLKSTIKALEKERDAVKLELRATPAPGMVFASSIEQAVQTSPERFLEGQQRQATVHLVAPQDEANLETSKQHNFNSGRVVGDGPSNVEEPFWSEFVARDQCLRDLHDEPFTYEDHIRALYEEVQATRNEVVRHREQIDFMHLQCQTGLCACKNAENRGERYIHDQAFNNFCQERARKKRKLDRELEYHQVPEHSTQPLVQEVDMYCVEEAAQIPLPSPTDNDFESHHPSPEPTAVLEELTQVMVEPAKEGQDAAAFVFSTSVSSHAPQRSTTPMSEHAPQVDLFDMTEARHHPPRPSTAMGILSIASPERSPIRLVPDSPDVASLMSERDRHHEERLAYTSQTVRVALKSPQRNPRRAQSRPNIRSQSRTRSPLHKSEASHTFDKASSASPVASTVFPVTPIAKHHRPETQQTMTTTTVIPLRDAEDDSIAYATQTPASSDNHAFTQPLHNVLHDREPNQMLSGITGTPVSRDAALAQIRARRDRARSLNMKKMDAGSKTPASARRGIVLKENLAAGLGRENREVSIASVQTAPGRF